MLLQNLSYFLDLYQKRVAWPLLVETYVWTLELFPLLSSPFLLNQLLAVLVVQPVILFVILLGATTSLLYCINLFGKMMVKI